MNIYLKGLFFLSYLLLSQTVFAEHFDPNSNYWYCSASDAEDKEWTVTSGYELAAINKAFDACKKESRMPATCKVAKENCEVFVNGLSTRPMWRCTALDQTAQPWRSNVYSQRDDAALAAKAYCQDESSLPDTCYINLITCRNLNSRE